VSAPAAASAVGFRFADLAAARIGYFDAGAGDCVLLVHGSYGSSSHWAHNVGALSRRARIVAPDLPGFGASANAPAGADLAYFARSLGELMEALGEPSFSLAGYSFGCLVAAQLAREKPASVRTLTLVSPPICATPPEMEELQRRIGELASRGATRAAVELMLERIALHEPGRRTEEAVRLTLDNLRRCRFRARPLQRASSLAELLKAVSCPVGALLGAADPFYAGEAARAAEKLEQALPGAQAQLVAGAAHWVCYDAPEATNAAILAAALRAPVHASVHASLK